MKNIRQHVLKPTWQKTKNSYELHFPFEASDLGVTARKRDSKMLHFKSTRIVKLRERDLKKCKRFQNKKVKDDEQKTNSLVLPSLPSLTLTNAAVNQENTTLVNTHLLHHHYAIKLIRSTRWQIILIQLWTRNWIGVLIYEIVDCNYLKVDNMVKNSDGWCLLSWTATITTIQKLSLTSLEPQTLYLCKSWP